MFLTYLLHVSDECWVFFLNPAKLFWYLNLTKFRPSVKVLRWWSAETWNIITELRMQRCFAPLMRPHGKAYEPHATFEVILLVIFRFQAFRVSFNAVFMSFRGENGNDVRWLSSRDMCCLSHMTYGGSWLSLGIKKTTTVWFKISIAMLCISCKLRYMCDVSSNHYIT